MENLKKFLIALYSVWSAISLVVLVGVLVINYGFDKPKTYGFQYFDDIKPNTDIVSDSVEEDNHFPIFELNICQSETNPDL